MNYHTMTLTLADAGSTAAPPPPSVAAPPPPSATPQQQASAANPGGNQSTTGAPSKPGQAKGQSSQHPTGLFSSNFFLLLLLVLAVMWIFMISNQRKDKKKRKQMLEQLTKGAKVQSVGGIIGTVVDVRGDEIVVKVDENANTRLRFSRSAIQTVLEDKSDA